MSSMVRLKKSFFNMPVGRVKALNPLGHSGQRGCTKWWVQKKPILGNPIARVCLNICSIYSCSKPVLHYQARLECYFGKQIKCVIQIKIRHCVKLRPHHGIKSLKIRTYIIALNNASLFFFLPATLSSHHFQ